MPKKKQTDLLTARTPAADAAAAILTRRINAVAKVLDRLSRRRLRDADYAHALRTSCRRASAAVDAFRPILDDGRARALKRLLRRIRRAAGPLRDADVLATTIPTLCAAFDHAGSPLEARLLRRAESRRRAGRRTLSRRLSPRDARELRSRLESLLKSVRSRPSLATFGQIARSSLSRAASRARGRFIRSADDPREMHAYRVRVKAVRYLFEFVGPALPPRRVARLAPIAIRISSAVGGLNDLRNAAAFISAVGKEIRDPHLRAQADDLAEGISEALAARSKIAFRTLASPDARRLFAAILPRRAK